MVLSPGRKLSWKYQARTDYIYKAQREELIFQWERNINSTGADVCCRVVCC